MEDKEQWGQRTGSREDGTQKGWDPGWGPLLLPVPVGRCCCCAHSCGGLRACWQGPASQAGLWAPSWAPKMLQGAGCPRGASPLAVGTGCGVGYPALQQLRPTKSPRWQPWRGGGLPPGSGCSHSVQCPNSRSPLSSRGRGDLEAAGAERAAHWLQRASWHGHSWAAGLAVAAVDATGMPCCPTAGIFRALHPSLKVTTGPGWRNWC